MDVGIVALAVGALLDRGHRRLAARGASAPARPRARPRARHGDRLRRAGLDQLRRQTGLRRRAERRDHGARADPVRGRPLQRLGRDPPAIGVSIALATVGTLLTAGITAVAAGLLFAELSTLEALILGSTVAATDAAAVFAVLRGSTLRRKLARTLEGESGINDPIAVLLVLGCIEAIQHADFGLAGRALAGARASWRSAPPSGSRSAASA